MNMFAFGAGCCCQGCSIATDDFDTTTVAGWTEVAKDWSSSSHRLTADDINATIRHDTAAAAGTIAVRASVDMIGQDDGDQLLLLIKYKDASNYWFARLTYGASGTLEIGKVEATVETVLRTT